MRTSATIGYLVMSLVMVPRALELRQNLLLFGSPVAGILQHSVGLPFPNETAFAVPTRR
jgi:hypothetical protein